MSKSEDFSDRVSSRVQIECPDFATLPANVKEKFENLPTKVNFFRMMGYSPGTFVEIHRSDERDLQKPDTEGLPQGTGSAECRCLC